MIYHVIITITPHASVNSSYVKAHSIDLSIDCCSIRQHVTLGHVTVDMACDMINRNMIIHLLSEWTKSRDGVEGQENINI